MNDGYRSTSSTPFRIRQTETHAIFCEFAFGTAPGDGPNRALRRKNQPPMTRKFSLLRMLIRGAIFV